MWRLRLRSWALGEGTGRSGLGRLLWSSGCCFAGGPAGEPGSRFALDVLRQRLREKIREARGQVGGGDLWVLWWFPHPAWREDAQVLAEVGPSSASYYGADGAGVGGLSPCSRPCSGCRQGLGSSVLQEGRCSSCHLGELGPQGPPPAGHAGLLALLSAALERGSASPFRESCLCYTPTLGDSSCPFVHLNAQRPYEVSQGLR